MQRNDRPAEDAGTAAFLCSDDVSFVIVAVLAVAGSFNEG